MDATQGQADDHPQDMTPDQLAADAAADADFEAAYNDARSDEPSTVGTTTEGNDDAAAQAQGVTQGNPYDLEHDANTGAQLVNAPNDDDAPVTLTKRQLAELTGARDMVLNLQTELRSTVDKTNGRFGAIQQTLKEVREQASQGIRPSFEMMEALEEDFPELASSIKRDLTKIFGRGNETRPEGEGQQAAGNASGAAAPGAAQAFNPLEAPEVRTALRDAHLAIVDARHEGWREFPATPEWQAWQGQLPQAARELLNTTADASTLSEALNDFKAYRQRVAAAASVSNQRGKRLEHAVPATTGSAGAVRNTVSDDDAFEAGFKNAARR